MERSLVWLQCRTGSLVSSVVPVSMGRRSRGHRGAPLLEGLQTVIKAQAEGEPLESMADTIPRLLPACSCPPSSRRLESCTPHFPGSQTAGVLGGRSFPLATGIRCGPIWTWEVWQRPPPCPFRLFSDATQGHRSARVSAAPWQSPCDSLLALERESGGNSSHGDPPGRAGSVPFVWESSWRPA